MQWRDTGFVIAARRHGENAAIVALLTGAHGLHAGLVRGGQAPRLRAVLQPGNEVAAVWRGRLPEHLGSFAIEPLRAHAARFIDDADRLAALAAAAALLAAALPERQPQPELHAGFADLIEAIAARPDWPAAYVGWECRLLGALGFGLDLRRCAVTGATDDLAYVSPRTGRAVSRGPAEPYSGRLLPLPAFLWREAPADPVAIAAGLALTGHFLRHHVLLPHGRPVPAERDLLAERLRRRAGPGGEVAAPSAAR